VELLNGKVLKEKVIELELADTRDSMSFEREDLFLFNFFFCFNEGIELNDIKYKSLYTVIKLTK
jgi:hypothetical protein